MTKAEAYAEVRVKLVDALRGFRDDERALKREHEKMWAMFTATEKREAEAAYFAAMRAYRWNTSPQRVA